MHQLALLLVLCVLTTALSWFLCGRVRFFLLKNAILDHPNSRSLHDKAIPRGGGWGMWLSAVPIILLAQIVAPFVLAPDHAQTGITRYLLQQQLPLLMGFVLLLIISWHDDKKALPVFMRLGSQVLAVMLVFSSFAPEIPIFNGWGLPLWLDRLLGGIGWLWFINLTNFMDGMDGITGAEAIHLCVGFIAIVLLTFPDAYWADHPIPYPPLEYAACIAGAAIGFLFWNKHPARLFLGDVGSVPLGFLLGYLMLNLLGQGYGEQALTLALYYVADATITLVSRVVKREKFWQAHREHFYQKAVMAVGQKKVLRAIILGNLGLLILSLLSLKLGVTILFAAPLIVGLLLWYLRRLSKLA
jgi:UDP-N-acetylmuramyl pentapeptide phosphotransferase/UDP-N-acetylglucosamine-1-phosphate transferase